MGNRSPETESSLGLDEKSLQAAHIESRVKRLRILTGRVRQAEKSEEVIDTTILQLVSDIDGKGIFNLEYLESLIGGDN